MKFSVNDFFSKCDQIRRRMRIWSHLLMKFLMEKFIFCVVYIQYIIVPDDWGDPAPWFVFGFRKTLYDCSTEQKAVGATLRMTKTFPKLQRLFRRKDMNSTILLWDTLNGNITGNFFSYIYHRFRDYLKPSVNFGNILGESSSHIGKQSFSYKSTVIKWLNDDSIRKVIFSHGASNCHLIQFDCDL